MTEAFELPFRASEPPQLSLVASGRGIIKNDQVPSVSVQAPTLALAPTCTVKPESLPRASLLEPGTAQPLPHPHCAQHKATGMLVGDLFLNPPDVCRVLVVFKCLVAIKDMGLYESCGYCGILWLLCIASSLLPGSDYWIAERPQAVSKRNISKQMQV